MRISKSTKTSVKASKSSKKYAGKNWGDFIANLEADGYKVDSAYRTKPDKWIVIKDNDGNYFDAEVTKYHNGDYELMEYNITKSVDACGDIKASKKLSANEQALTHIRAAIDILGKSGKKDDITKDSIANLAVVMFDLKGE